MTADSTPVPAPQPTPNPAVAVSAGRVDCTRSYCVALTFSGGPVPGTTQDVLHVLRKHAVAATFCVVGQRVAQNPDLVAAIGANGHELCNQGYTNAPFTALSAAGLAAQLARTDQQIAQAGAEPGAYARSSSGQVRATGLDRPAAGWTVDSLDRHYTDPEYLSALVVRQARPGGIILLHDTYPWTASAVDRIITDLRAAGLVFVTLDSMLWQEGLQAGAQARSGPAPAGHSYRPPTAAPEPGPVPKGPPAVPPTVPPTVLPTVPSTVLPTVPSTVLPAARPTVSAPDPDREPSAPVVGTPREAVIDSG